jgi:hypothetical protein
LKSAVLPQFGTPTSAMRGDAGREETESTVASM